MLLQNSPKEKKQRSIVKNEDFEKEFLELKKIAEKAREIYKEELKWKEKHLKN